LSYSDKDCQGKGGNFLIKVLGFVKLFGILMVAGNGMMVMLADKRIGEEIHLYLRKS